MTKFESKDNYFKVTRECTQTQACQNNAGGNVPKCYPGENGVSAETFKNFSFLTNFLVPTISPIKKQFTSSQVVDEKTLKAKIMALQ